VGLTVGGGSEAPDLRDELQDAPGFSVLAGLERPEMRERLAVEHINPGLHSVGRGFGAVTIDAGEMVASTASAASVAFLRLADRVLVVTTADLMGLWNARGCLRYLGDLKGLRSEAISIVINRHTGHEQHNAAEVERALGLPVLAVIPRDERAARKARDRQEPFAARGGPAASELRALAQRLAQGALSVAEEPPRKERGRWHWRRHSVEEKR
jgi:pilus assembly protein CpaE